MTLAEMVDEVATRMRNDNVSIRIKGWLNQSMNDLAASYEFPALHAMANFNSAVGVQSYLLEDNLYWLKAMWVDGRTPPMIWPTTEADLASCDPYFRSQRGTVYYYYLNDRTLGLWRIPASVETFTYTYQKRPVKMVNDDDRSSLPPEWDQLVLLKTMIRAYEYDRNDLVNSAKADFSFFLKDRSKTVYHRSDFPVILKSYSQAPVGLGRPQLPPNYPRIR